jgi:hypothetical protein
MTRRRARAKTQARQNDKIMTISKMEVQARCPSARALQTSTAVPTLKLCCHRIEGWRDVEATMAHGGDDHGHHAARDDGIFKRGNRAPIAQKAAPCQINPSQVNPGSAAETPASGGMHVSFFRKLTFQQRRYNALIIHSQKKTNGKIASH